jgi:hypothetical protein
LAFEFEQMTVVHHAIDSYRHVTGGREDNTPQYSLTLTYQMRAVAALGSRADINARDSPLASYTIIIRRT